MAHQGDDTLPPQSDTVKQETNNPDVLDSFSPDELSADLKEPLPGNSQLVPNKTEEPDKAEPQKTSQPADALVPTTIVLAKVKGFRAWPAMVLEEAILPDNIKKLKPRSPKPVKGKPVTAVPVRFFKDDTYIWMRSNELQILSLEQIQAFLNKKAKTKKKDLLTLAYTLARDPPDMHEFNMWGSAGPPPDEPPQKKLKLRLLLKKEKQSNGHGTPSDDSDTGYADYDQFEQELDNMNAVSESDQDSDWGLGDNDSDRGEDDYIFEDEQQQREFEHNFPSGQQLADELAGYTAEIKRIFAELAPPLTSGEVLDERKVIQEITKVDRLIKKGDMPLVCLTKSSLYRLLLLVMHMPHEVFLYKKVRRAIEAVFRRLKFEPSELSVDDLMMPDDADALGAGTPIASGKDEESGDSDPDHSHPSGDSGGSDAE